MNIKRIREILEATNGRAFTVTFMKKDGTIRTMNCRTGVKKHLKGGASTIAHKPNLMSVWDLKSEGYRSINLSTVINAKVDGAVIDFRNDTVEA